MNIEQHKNNNNNNNNISIISSRKSLFSSEQTQAQAHA
jgi:hypothetical protein